jgi:hypothetical protein
LQNDAKDEDYCRPIRSATGAAVRAPKNVPVDKIETIVADCEAVMLRLPRLSLKLVEKVRSQYFMARIPLIVLVSYLFMKRISVYSLREQQWSVDLPKQHTPKGHKEAY